MNMKNMGDIITIILHEDDAELNKTLGTFKAVANQEISKNCRKLEQKVKSGKEIQLVAGIYSAFIIFLAIFLWNFILCGFNRMQLFLLTAVGFISVVLLCCIPLLLKFKENIFERRDYQNEIKKIH